MTISKFVRFACAVAIAAPLQIVEEYPDSAYANHAKTRLAELEKAR